MILAQKIDHHDASEISDPNDPCNLTRRFIIHASREGGETFGARPLGIDIEDDERLRHVKHDFCAASKRIFSARKIRQRAFDLGVRKDIYKICTPFFFRICLIVGENRVRFIGKRQPRARAIEYARCRKVIFGTLNCQVKCNSTE